MTWKIEYHDGSSWQEISGKIVRIFDELNKMVYAEFTIPNNATNRSIVSQDRDVRISWNGTQIFYGVLSGAEFTSESLRCICYDKVFYQMKKELFTGTYSGVAASTVLSDICSAAGVSSYVDPSYNLSVSLRFNKAKCFDAAVAVAEAVNGDFWSSGGTTFNIGEKGSDKGTLSVISYSARVMDRIQQVNHVYVRGVDANGNEIVGEASSGAGDRPKVFIVREATDLATLNKIAERKLRELNTDSWGVEVTTKITSAYNIYSGDTITVDIPEIGLSGSYRVWRVIKEIGAVTISIDKASGVIIEEEKSKPSVPVEKNTTGMTNVTNTTEITNVTNTTEISNIINTTNVTNVKNATGVTNVANSANVTNLSSDGARASSVASAIGSGVAVGTSWTDICSDTSVSTPSNRTGLHFVWIDIQWSSGGGTTLLVQYRLRARSGTVWYNWIVYDQLIIQPTDVSDIHRSYVVDFDLSSMDEIELQARRYDPAGTTPVSIDGSFSVAAVLEHTHDVDDPPHPHDHDEHGGHTHDHDEHGGHTHDHDEGEGHTHDHDEHGGHSHGHNEYGGHSHMINID